MFDLSKSTTDEIIIDAFNKRGIRLWVKRDDLIDDQVSGNKWRKLKYNVELCLSRKKTGILTFGGAYSNHLLATAAACNRMGLNSIGIVRGDELNEFSNETLVNCNQLGMQLKFVSRKEYASRNEKSYLETLSSTYENFLIVPEGGANYYGMIGCQEVIKEVSIPIDHIFVAQGTSATSAGLLLGMSSNQKLHVVPVLKGYDSIEEMRTLFLSSGMEADYINNLLNQVEVLGSYHFGGYGKYNDELLSFVQSFYTDYKLKLDPIYTGKVMFGLMHELENESYSNSNVLFVHTGGLQGVRGVEVKSGVSLFD